MDNELLTPLSTLGLIVDFIGTFYLAKAIAFTPGALFYQQSQTYSDFNVRLLKSLVEQRFDAQFGLMLVLAGLFVQILSNFGPQVPIGAAAVPLPLVLIAVIRRSRSISFRTAVDTLAILNSKGEDVAKTRNNFPELTEAAWRHAVSLALRKKYLI